MKGKGVVDVKGKEVLEDDTPLPIRNGIALMCTMSTETILSITVKHL